MSHMDLEWGQLEGGIAELIEFADDEESAIRAVNAIEEFLGMVWMWELTTVTPQDLRALPGVGDIQVAVIQRALLNWAEQRCVGTLS